MRSKNKVYFKQHDHEWVGTLGVEKEMCLICGEMQLALNLLGGSKPTQKETILELLRKRDVCGDELLEMHMPRYAGRIYELRADGYEILSRKCKQHDWHQSNIVEYILVREPKGKR
jgi:hypothetical protein